MQRKAEPARVLIYKKRTGELVTRDDPEGRRTVFRKLPKLGSGRWIAIGRLDINTSGLLLFTNHGELARRLTHPSFEVPRTYAVRILGTVDDAVIARWKAGVELEDGKAKFERVEAGVNEDGEGANQWFHVTVREGRNRLVRRLIESQKLQVSRLIRISYGPVELGRGIKSGTAREATPAELLALLDAVRLSEADAGLDAGRKPVRGGKSGARHVAGKPPAPRRRRADDREEADDGRPRRASRDAVRAGAKARDARPGRASGDARPASRSGGGKSAAPARASSPRSAGAGKPASRRRDDRPASPPQKPRRPPRTRR
nr:pseudouridine synthase [Solimonas terrae]